MPQLAFPTTRLPFQLALVSALLWRVSGCRGGTRRTPRARVKAPTFDYVAHR